MKQISCIILFILVSISAYTQVDDPFDGFASQDDFSSFQQQMEQRFSSFQDTINSRFAKELERQWTEYNVFKGEKRPTKPRPQTLPQADTSHHSQSSDELPVGQIIEPSVLPLQENDVPPVPQEDPLPTPQRQSVLNTLSTTFYLQPLQCPYPKAYADVHLRDVTENSVANFWKHLACEGYEEFVNQCRQTEQTMQLNDWGVFELAKALARRLFPDQFKEQTIFTIFTLNQLGYKARIGRIDGQFVCLVPCHSKIYGVPFIETEKGTIFYIFNLSPQTLREADIYTYDLDFPTAQAYIDMNIYYPMRLTENPADSVFTARIRGEKIAISVNQSVIGFYENYPFVDLEIYANAKPESKWAATVDSVFSSILKGKIEYEAVDILLSFLHKSFSYEYDDEQFGREKYLFCEENFYYSSNDCEDRSILFSYLVRHLVGLDVILLDYPDHIATAVHFNDPIITGDYYTYKGKKYIVCDPTYIGADIGETMPRYKNVKANVIELKK